MKTVESPFMLIDKCTDMVRDHAPRIFALWKPENLHSYFEFHNMQGSMAVRKDALAVGWRCDSEVIRAPEFLESPWRYSKEDPRGNALYIDLLVGKDRKAFSPLIAELQWRFPNWRHLEFLFHRRGKLRSCDPEKFLSRLEMP